MHIAERREGEHHIYAAASEAPTGGFVAGCVVMRRVATHLAAVEIFRDERLEDGRVWIYAPHALAFALEVGVAAIRAQAGLACARERAIEDSLSA